MWANTKHSIKELMPKVKAKLEERKTPSAKQWDEKKKIVTSCHLIEEKGNDFYCDCYEGIRGRMCEHTIGMYFRNKFGKIPVTEDIRSLPISQKRTRGWPKQLPKACLTSSPPREVLTPIRLLDVCTEEMEMPDPADREEPAAVLELPCILCQKDGVQAVAEVSCACGDNLCMDCRRAHARTRATRNHVVTDPTEPADDEIADISFPVLPPSPGPGRPVSPAPVAAVPAPVASPARAATSPARAATPPAPPARAASPAPPPVMVHKTKVTRVTCNLCGQKEVDTKSIRANERSAKCKKLNAAKRPAPALSPELSKRQRPTAASSSTPPQARPNRGKRTRGIK